MWWVTLLAFLRRFTAQLRDNLLLVDDAPAEYANKIALGADEQASVDPATKMTQTTATDGRRQNWS